MGMSEKDLGIVTAYGFAKSKGYTGTVEEFAEFMAKIPDLFKNRVTSLDDTNVASGEIVEAVGNPVYVDDVTKITELGVPDFELTETGWYVFARVAAKTGVTVQDGWSVEGAAGCIASVGSDYVDLAVRFEVAAVSKRVVINWGESSEVFVFKATDLAIRNLDYRVTFYVYDIKPYTIWEYALTTDETYVEEKHYWILQEDGTYAPAEVTVGEMVPAYYTLSDEVYTQATGSFEDGVTYYTKSGTEYTAAEVTVGDIIPAYYVHSKVTFDGMIRNITYVCNTPIDCPVTFVLPDIEDETHGCWFEARCLFTGTFSTTLVPPTSDVKVATEHTQQEQKGINMINLHYTAIAGTKVWRFMNTRSTIPA